MTSESEYIQREGATRVRILSEALPYIQEFAGRTVVVKYGGAAMKNSSLKDKVIRDIVFLSSVGVHPVVVHGGGPEINIWLEMEESDREVKEDQNRLVKYHQKSSLGCQTKAE